VVWCGVSRVACVVRRASCGGVAWVCGLWCVVRSVRCGAVCSMRCAVCGLWCVVCDFGCVWVCVVCGVCAWCGVCVWVHGACGVWSVRCVVCGGCVRGVCVRGVCVCVGGWVGVWCVVCGVVWCVVYGSTGSTSSETLGILHPTAGRRLAGVVSRVVGSWYCVDLVIVVTEWYGSGGNAPDGLFC
jgi:hypothetical protein